MTHFRRLIFLLGSCLGTVLLAQPNGPTDALFSLHVVASSIIGDATYWLRPDGTYVVLYSHGKVSALPATYDSGETGTYTLSANSKIASASDIVLTSTTSAGTTKQAMTINFATGTTTFPATSSSFGWLSRRSAPMVNTSSRGYVSSGHGSTTGFVLSEGRWVLIRGIGPTLASFQVTDALPNPKVRVYSGSKLLNDSELNSTADYYAGQYDETAPWYSDSDFVAGLNAVFSMVGAFPLPAATADRATLMFLGPGAYTVEVNSTDGATAGSVLAEVYVLPYGPS